MHARSVPSFPDGHLSQISATDGRQAIWECVILPTHLAMCDVNHVAPLKVSVARCLEGILVVFTAAHGVVPRLVVQRRSHRAHPARSSSHSAWRAGEHWDTTSRGKTRLRTSTQERAPALDRRRPAQAAHSQVSFEGVLQDLKAWPAPARRRVHPPACSRAQRRPACHDTRIYQLVESRTVCTLTRVFSIPYRAARRVRRPEGWRAAAETPAARGSWATIRHRRARRCPSCPRPRPAGPAARRCGKGHLFSLNPLDCLPVRWASPG